MRYIDVVLNRAKSLAWEGLTDEQRTNYLKSAVRSTGGKPDLSTLRRWAVQTGPTGEGV